MANTSIDLPGDLLEALDEMAKAEGESRNRIIVAACRQMLERRQRWPRRLLKSDHLSATDLESLAEGHLLEEIRAARRSREEAPF